MNQHRCPKSGANVGRTRGKVTRFRMECECKSLSQLGVQPIHLSVRRVQRKAGMETLKPQVIFFVQHDAEAVLHQEGGPRAHSSVGVQTGEFLTHQVTLVQQLPVGPFQPVEAELDRPPQQHSIASGRLDDLEDVLSLRLRIASLKDAPGQVTRQPDPGREHEVTRGAAGVEPSYPAIGQQAEIDHSTTRSRSRSSAASSKFSVSTASRSCSRSSAVWCCSLGGAVSRSLYRSPMWWVEPWSRRSRSRSGTSKER